MDGEGFSPDAPGALATGVRIPSLLLQIIAAIHIFSKPLQSHLQSNFPVSGMECGPGTDLRSQPERRVRPDRCFFCHGRISEGNLRIFFLISFPGMPRGILERR